MTRVETNHAQMAQQLALDTISLAIRASMPATFWLSDSRIARACTVLDITPEQARDLSANVYRDGLPGTLLGPESAPAFEPPPDPGALPTVLEVWTDGGCDPNPGPGGWGWVTNEDTAREGHGGHPDTTNNRMEIQAVIEALTTINERPIVVHSDSKYVVDTIVKRWYVGWNRNGWKNSQGKSVKNRDLWEILVPLGAVPEVSWVWVKGHAGTPLNERADRLATAGIAIGKKARA